MFVACCLSAAVRGVLFVVCLLRVVCRVFVVCCTLCDVRCLLFVGC